MRAAAPSADQPTSSPQPLRSLLAVPPADGVALAIDIGGTKLACGLVDATGAVLCEDRRPTGDARDAHDLFARLTGLVDSVLGASPAVPQLCGVGCGGPMEAGGETVSPINIAVWRRFPLRSRLADHLGLATWVDNDAKALALAEGWVGAAVGVRNYIGMVVSTGVGGGIVCDGRLLDGDSGNAGHIGHVNVEPDGRLCGCGARGCLEAEASGTGIATATGHPAVEADLATRRRTGTLVGRAVSSVACLLDLQLAVVAGSVALGFGDDFFAAANEEVTRRARLEFAAPLRVVPAGLGAVGPLVGAAAVGWRGSSLAG